MSTGALPAEIVELVVRAAGADLWSALTCDAFRSAVRRVSPALCTGATDVVASVGRLDWARSVGCPFDDYLVARVAAEEGQTDVLATVEPTPTDTPLQLVCASSAEESHWTTLRWAVDRGWLANPGILAHADYYAETADAAAAAAAMVRAGIVRPVELDWPTPDNHSSESVADALADVERLGCRVARDMFAVVSGLSDICRPGSWATAHMVSNVRYADHVGPIFFRVSRLEWQPLTPATIIPLHALRECGLRASLLLRDAPNMVEILFTLWYLTEDDRAFLESTPVRVGTLVVSVANRDAYMIGPGALLASMDD